MRKLKENIDNKRKCSICNEVKELNSENFHSDKSRSLGYMYNCRKCEKERTKNKYLKNPRTGRYSTLTKEEKLKKYNVCRLYVKTTNGRAVILVSCYKSIDKKKGYGNDLTKEYVLSNIINNPCIYCGDTFNIGCDRIDNSLGHLISNVVPCCPECNIARMDNFTFEEMKIIGSAIRIVKENRLKTVFQIDPTTN